MKPIEEFRQKIANALNQNIPYVIISTDLARDIYLQLIEKERIKNGNKDEKK